MPINASGISRKVAEGAYCANQQEKFWEYHDLAFAKQNDLKKDSALALAKELKLDEAKFKTCYEDPKTAEAVKASEEEGRQLGVSGTPSFFINGKPLNFHVDMVKETEAAVDAALAPAGTSATTPATPAAGTATESKLGTCGSSTTTTDGGAAGGCKPDDVSPAPAATSTTTTPASSSTTTTSTTATSSTSSSSSSTTAPAATSTPSTTTTP